MKPIPILAGLAVLATAAAAPARPITVKGSDTMVILGQRWAEAYMRAHPGAKVQVTGGGSGTGISSLINGATDLCNSSRAMKEKERRHFRDKYKAEVVETPVAMDGIAIYLHPSNPVETLSLAQLKAIYTGKTTDWKQVGGKPGRIILYGRENNSGTYAYFKEYVLAEKDFAPETQTLPGTAAVTNAVSKDPASIGYGGIAYAKGIKILPVRKDEASEPVEPSMENVIDGSYPIGRYLFCYSRPDLRAEAKAYLDWIVSEEGQRVVENVGYYPLPGKNR